MSFERATLFAIENGSISNLSANTAHVKTYGNQHCFRVGSYGGDVRSHPVLAFKTLARRSAPLKFTNKNLPAPFDQCKGRVVMLPAAALEAVVMLAKPSRLSFASPVLSTCGAPGSLLALLGT